jgi:CheY-like chemotaxis protein
MFVAKIVLVADDSDADFFILEKAFELAKLSHKLLRVRDGDQAIIYLKGEKPFGDRERWPFPDLLVLDEKMPSAGGFEVLQFLEGQTEIRVPAVLLSGSVAPQDVHKALELGAAEYIRKPEGLSELIVMVQTIHHRWLANGERGLRPD